MIEENEGADRQPEQAGDRERTTRAALSCTVEGGDPAVAEVVAVSGAGAAWEQVLAGGFGAGLAERAQQLDLDRVWSEADRARVRFIIPGDAEWPDRLADLRYCDELQRRGGVPFGLWLRGSQQLAEVARRSVAIVGARAATPYGVEVATDLAAELAEAGITIISGGAYGIDTAAHRGAAAAGRPTVAVVANGADVAYPQGNSRLFSWVAEHGLLVSELAPGTTPSRIRFLARNRLIAALTQGTVVVEAALRSGARNTASWAVGCGRILMAVPGSVDSALSQTPHYLIRSGQATLICNAAQVLELISAPGQHLLAAEHGPVRATDDLEPTRLAVYEAVPARRAVAAGEIALAAAVPVPVALTHLAALAEDGLVVASDLGWRALTRSAS